MERNRRDAENQRTHEDLYPSSRSRWIRGPGDEGLRRAKARRTSSIVEAMRSAMNKMKRTLAAPEEEHRSGMDAAIAIYWRSRTPRKIFSKISRARRASALDAAGTGKTPSAATGSASWQEGPSHHASDAALERSANQKNPWALFHGRHDPAGLEQEATIALNQAATRS